MGQNVDLGQHPELMCSLLLCSLWGLLGFGEQLWVRGGHLDAGTSLS